MRVAYLVVAAVLKGGRVPLEDGPPGLLREGHVVPHEVPEAQLRYPRGLGPVHHHGVAALVQVVVQAEVRG